MQCLKANHLPAMNSFRKQSINNSWDTYTFIKNKIIDLKSKDIYAV